MIPSTMLGVLRRRLNDTSEQNWDNDDDLYDLLNEGLHLVQTEVVEFNPTAFMHISRAPLVADQEWYALPDGFWYELRVKVKESSSASTYGQIERGVYDRDQGLTVSSQRCYDIQGRFITFMPTPDFSVSPGFELHFVPTLSLDPNHAVAPELHQGLHMAVVIWAQLLALGEDPGSSTSEPAQLLTKMLSNIPKYYKQGGEAPTLRIDAGQPRYFRRGSNLPTPGTDIR